ncbi:hypothetical protein F5884DRAFT_900056 [Xylogone sp. PMI_703]|nr:hypothetical protein F5884DRAFT_900056 [Xylogone sp. PMI_703]
MAANSVFTSECPQSDSAQHESVRLRYIQWKDEFDFEKPYEILSETPEGFPRSNFTISLGPEETIHDIRGQESKFNLDNHAFEIRTHKLTVSSFDKDTIEQEYLGSIKSFLQEFDPGAEVYIFDWRLRSSDLKKTKFVPGAVIDLNDPLVYLQPVLAAHVDQSQFAARQRVEHHMGARAEKLLKRSVWRPLHNPIENYPLAVCDGSTVPADMLVAVDHVRKYYTGESLYPLACSKYRWHYLNLQTKDEVLLFKTFDSKEDVPAKCCPHTSFAQSGVRANANSRETIEVRALVFSKE